MDYLEIKDLRHIAIAVLAATCANKVENESSPYHGLFRDYVRPQADIIDNFQQAAGSLDIEEEISEAIEFASKIIKKLDEQEFSFQQMWETDPVCAEMEIFAVMGYGISFWDNYRPEEFGLPQGYRSKVLVESPYAIAERVLQKIMGAQ